MIKLLEKLGRDPQRSLTLFLWGLGLFVIGLCFVALGYYHHYLWQIIGIALVGIAIILSSWGYIGIFANRWLNIIYRANPNNKHFK